MDGSGDVAESQQKSKRATSTFGALGTAGAATRAQVNELTGRLEASSLLVFWCRDADQETDRQSSAQNPSERERGKASVVVG